MRKASALLILVLFLAMPTSEACINISRGKLVETADELLPYGKDGLRKAKNVRTHWADLARDLEARMAANPTIRDRSDYGGVLLHLRQFEKGRDVLLEAERIAPGDYAVASNLGTAYELLGDVPKALEWIGKGMERNPQSHQGTEWVHVKILESKLLLERDPNALQNRSVLGLAFGSAAQPTLPGMPEDVKKEAYRIINAVGYQLTERLNFVKAPDPIVGDLLFDLANAFLIRGAAETALDVHELAGEYGAPRIGLLVQRMSFAQQLMYDARMNQTGWESFKDMIKTPGFIIFALIAAGLSIAAVAAMRAGKARSR